MLKVEKGDIVVRYRPQYDKRWYMFWKYLIQRAICFFTTEYWDGENTTNVSHAEFVNKQLSEFEFQVFSMEPPYARMKNRRFKRCIIFRAKDKPTNFNAIFNFFVSRWTGRTYEYWKIFLFVLDWIFRTNWFSKRWDLSKTGVCSEMVASGCEDLGTPCSDKDPKSTDPDTIRDYCLSHPEKFEVIFDRKE